MVERITNFNMATYVTALNLGDLVTFTAPIYYYDRSSKRGLSVKKTLDGIVEKIDFCDVYKDLGTDITYTFKTEFDGLFKVKESDFQAFEVSKINNKFKTFNLGPWVYTREST